MKLTILRLYTLHKGLECAIRGILNLSTHIQLAGRRQPVTEDSLTIVRLNILDSTHDTNLAILLHDDVGYILSVTDSQIGTSSFTESRNCTQNHRRLEEHSLVIELSGAWDIDTGNSLTLKGLLISETKDSQVNGANDRILQRASRFSHIEVGNGNIATGQRLHELCFSTNETTFKSILVCRLTILTRITCSTRFASRAYSEIAEVIITYHFDSTVVRRGMTYRTLTRQSRAISHKKNSRVSSNSNQLAVRNKLTVILSLCNRGERHVDFQSTSRAGFTRLSMETFNPFGFSAYETKSNSTLVRRHAMRASGFLPVNTIKGILESTYFIFTNEHNLLPNIINSTYRILDWVRGLNDGNVENLTRLDIFYLTSILQRAVDLQIRCSPYSTKRGVEITTNLGNDATDGEFLTILFVSAINCILGLNGDNLTNTVIVSQSKLDWRHNSVLVIKKHWLYTIPFYIIDYY